MPFKYKESCTGYGQGLCTQNVFNLGALTAFRSWQYILRLHFRRRFCQTFINITEHVHCSRAVTRLWEPLGRFTLLFTQQKVTHRNAKGHEALGGRKYISYQKIQHAKRNTNQTIRSNIKLIYSTHSGCCFAFIFLLYQEKKLDKLNCCAHTRTSRNVLCVRKSMHVH